MTSQTAMFFLAYVCSNFDKDLPQDQDGIANMTINTPFNDKAI